MPTHLVVVVAWRWFSPAFKQVYFTANAALVAALLLGAYTLPQQLHPAFLPILLFIAWRSWRVAIRQRRLSTRTDS
jgi:hypothetical protein